MAYAIADDTVADSWVSLEVIKQRLPVATTNMSREKAPGFQLVTREFTTESKFVVPLPSSYIPYQESLPMIPDPVLQYYLKEDLAYKANKEPARQSQEYS